MISDFKLSQFRAVLHAAGWTEGDIDLFMTEGMPAQMLEVVRDSATLESLTTEMHIKLHGKKLITDVFTPEITLKLGYRGAIRTRVLQVFRSRPHDMQGLEPEEHPPFETIAEIAPLPRHKLLRITGLSGESVAYIADVLATLGITLRKR